MYDSVFLCVFPYEKNIYMKKEKRILQMKEIFEIGFHLLPELYRILGGSGLPKKP